MKLSTKIVLSAFSSLVLILSSCGEDESTPALVLPSNFNINVSSDSVAEGLVHVQASSINSNFYTYVFVEGNAVQAFENKTGIISHEFKTTGNHLVRVRAHSTTDQYVEKVQAIYIRIGAPGNGGNYPTTGYTTPISQPGYTLVWNDEFDGSALNTADWNYEIGNGTNGWGNLELQYYLQSNVRVADGFLTIEAKNEFSNGFNYTSSRITTQGKQKFQYGRVDIRAAMPYGQGLWPALWMLGSNISDPLIEWPSCGEIDIMEMVGGTTTDPTRGDEVVFGTAHWDQNGSNAKFGNTKQLSTGTLADNFHVYSIVWDSQSIIWYLDDVKYHEIDITPTDLDEFQKEFFFIMNVAVGGNLPGNPDFTTQFPQRMFVDYIRVFQ